MRIGMVLAPHPFPPDIRVEKEAGVLTSAGHEVIVLCAGKEGLPVTEPAGDVTVIRHRVYGHSWLRRKTDSARFLATLKSSSWREVIESLVRVHGCEAIHVHDLPYTATAMEAARATGVPLVVDLHENWPAALALYRRRLIDRLFFPPWRAAGMEKRIVAQADRVIVVVDEARDRVVGLGAPADRVTVFGNLEPRALAEPDPPPLFEGPGPRLIYVGGVARHRGIETAVAAMPSALAACPDAVLTVVGDGDYLPDLREQVAELGLGDSVRLLGRLPFTEAMEEVRRSDIGLVPHHRSPHTDATVPHKLFQYMALGRPVIVSDCAPLARIVTETGAGGVFTDPNPGILASRIIELSDLDRAREAGRRGREAVLHGRWNLESDAPALLAIYKGLERATA